MLQESKMSNNINPRTMRRLAAELKECTNETAWNIRVESVSGSLFQFEASFPGPQGTPYERGIFHVDITMPETYPFRPPKIKFMTKIYHPDVSSASGLLCLDILQDMWCPALTLRTIMLSVQSLLSPVEISDNPADPEIAKHYLTNKDSFEETARLWTEKYASGLDSREIYGEATITEEVEP